MKVFIAPTFRGEDRGDGGIRRVVEAQHKYLPEFDVKIVDTVDAADIVAVHAGLWVETNKPVVSHCHGLYWSEYEWALWARKLNQDVIRAMRKADVVTAPSKWISNILKKGMWLDAPVLYHGIDIDDWEPGVNREYVLWNKTRIDPICDPYPVHMLSSRAKDTHFVTTFYEPNHNPNSNVLVTGTRPYQEAKAFVQSASVYLATTRETFGIGTLEAMACGVPILGWAWGGQAEIIEHKKTGWLSRPGDYDHLLEGLQYCIEHRERLGQAAREVVLSSFTWHTAMERYASLYKSLLPSQDLRSRPLVSVVIPLYNLGEFLPRAVNSVLAQTEKDLEVIIVNDASTDDSLEVAEALSIKDKRIKVVSNESNQYLAEALNRGIVEASGKYILPLDADNEIAPNTLKTLSAALDADRTIDIVYGAVEFVEPDEHRFISKWPGDFSFAGQMQRKNQIPSTSLYRKRVWQRSGGYRRRCRTAEDADFWTRIVSLGFQPLRVTDAKTLIYHIRTDSMSHVQPDWDWTAWYPWCRNQSLTPFGAVASYEPRIPTYEPSLVTVVIPVGPGHTNLVVDAVDSLVAQTFQNFNVIVVNDSTEKIRWLHPFATIVETGGRLGPAKARNIGIEKSNTPLFVLLDADDYLHPSALQEMYEAWKQHGGYIYSDWIVAETGKVEKSFDYNCKQILQKLPHAVTAMYPRKAWEEVGGFDETITAWEDWDFVIALAAAGYCGYRLESPLLYYRLQSGSRRNELYANRKELEKQIHAKWKDYIEGRKDLMACSGCKKSKSTAVASSKASNPNLRTVAATTTLDADSDMVKLQFTLEGAGPRIYRGRATGTRYKFGSDEGHRIKYVHKSDADALLLLKEFEKYTEPQSKEHAALVAAGPPQK